MSLGFLFDEVEVVVVGGGHAGIEAALASSGLLKRTILVTMSLDSLANMPCNPSIGGTAKGQLVRELDAIGGHMGRICDKTLIQCRVLNSKKGPAVHSLRAQVDRMAYHVEMKNLLESRANLLVLQDEIVKIQTKEGKVHSVLTKLGLEIKTKAVVLACGTFLGSKIFIGDYISESGPDGAASSNELAHSLKSLGVQLRRFKTGTSARVKKSSIDFSELAVQEGDENLTGFSFSNETVLKNRAICHICATNEKTHEVILKNLDKTALYGGKIEGVGPLYCPSIEDKVVRFKGKPSHQFFIEPVGLNSGEMYLQGLSTSLPFDVQLQFLKTIKGFSNVQIMRSAYAIEYYCCNPLHLFSTLEHKKIEGLFGAGQFNGTSGYEEAAVQGFVAGVNAALKVSKKEPLILSRNGSLIGTLIDDLITKGCEAPYRMMMARSENRLILRHDNADFRLTPVGYKLGLVNEEHFEKFCRRQEQIEKELARIKKVVIKPSAELNEALVAQEAQEISRPYRFFDLLKRPNVSYKTLLKFDYYLEKPECELNLNQIERIEIEVKYEGYVAKQQRQIKKLQQLERMKLPQNFDYFQIIGLKKEAQQQLNRVKPQNLGQATRIYGVNPSDIAVLLVWLKKHGFK